MDNFIGKYKWLGFTQEGIKNLKLPKIAFVLFCVRCSYIKNRRQMGVTSGQGKTTFCPVSKPTKSELSTGILCQPSHAHNSAAVLPLVHTFLECLQKSAVV